MFHRTFAALFLVAVGFSIGGGAGCASNSSSSGGSDCSANPTQCPQGQTCWPVTQTAFGCVPSQPTGTFGSQCIEQYGKATCADGMLCDATDPTGNGTCTSYCTGGGACPQGYECHATAAGNSGPTVDICRAATAPPPPSSEEGGIGIGDGGGDVAYLGNIDATLGPDASGSVH